MHIAWVVYDDLTARTGGTIYDAHVVRALRAAGDEVDVVAIPAPGRLRRGHALARRLARLAPDVVVGDELCFRELAVAFAWGRPPARRVLLVHHLTAWEEELRPSRRLTARVVETFAARAADALVATSAATARRLRREVQREAEVVIPGADRLALVDRHGLGENRDASRDGLRLLFVGTIAPRKRVLELVRAFRRGAPTSARLDLVGSVVRERAYARVVADAIADLGGRVVLRGEVDEPTLARHYASADLLVMPSSLEGFGIAATEALWAGTPVLAVRTEALAEALSPCPSAAMLVDADDLDAAIAAITRAPEHLARLKGAAAAARARLPTWEGCGASFRATLSALVNGAAARATARRIG